MDTKASEFKGYLFLWIFFEIISGIPGATFQGLI